MTIRDDYLAHEFLENDNEPQTFTQFFEECAGCGLSFLGEADVAMQMAENFDVATRDLLLNLSGNRIAPMEQSIDIVTGRTFRQTLLVRASREAAIQRVFDRSRLQNLHFLGPIAALSQPASTAGWTFGAPIGRTLSTSSPAVQRAFAALIARGPGSIAYEELLEAATSGSGASAEADRALAVDAIYKAVASGIIEPRAAPVKATDVISECPLAPDWLRRDVEAGEAALTNLRHESLALDVVPRMIAPLLDGSRPHHVLSEALEERVRAGDLRFVRGSEDVREETEIAACVAEHMALALRQLRDRAALLS
jgi:methyltransferase-like protein